MAKRRMVDEETGELFEIEMPEEDAVKAYKEQQAEQKQAPIDDENKNPPFIQLTKGVSPAVLSKVSKENPSSIQVLMFFFENMDDYNVIVVSQQTIADAIEMTVRSVARAIKTLEDHSAIGIGKVGNANVYIINPHIAWQKAFKKRGVVVIKGNILLGRAENEKLFQKFGKVLYDTKDNNLKVSNVATKVVKTREPNRPKKAVAAPEEPSQPELEEYEYNVFDESGTIPEDVPPWEKEQQ